MDDWCYGLDHDRVDVAESRLPPPVLTFIGGGRWRLEQSYAYRDGDTAVSVPAGFDFDLSSVPRLFWFLVAPFELSIAAPLLHDFLYRYGGRPPAERSLLPARTRAPRRTGCSARSCARRASRRGDGPSPTRRSGSSGALPGEASPAPRGPSGQEGHSGGQSVYRRSRRHSRQSETC